MTFPRTSIKTSNFNKNITHNLLGIHKKMVILNLFKHQPVVILNLLHHRLMFSLLLYSSILLL